MCYSDFYRAADRGVCSMWYRFPCNLNLIQQDPIISINIIIPPSYNKWQNHWRLQYAYIFAA